MGTVTPRGSPLNWRPTNPAFWAELTTGQLHELDDSAARHDSPSAFCTERLQGEPPSSIHPEVRTHPLTKRRARYVNSGYTTRIVELAGRESDALLPIGAGQEENRREVQHGPHSHYAHR
jgi:hypothetical protein